MLHHRYRLLFLLGAALCAVAAHTFAAAPAANAAPSPATNPAALPHYGAWQSCRIGGGGYVQNVVPCPSNPKRYYAYIDVGGLYRSDDGGLHWIMLHGSLPARRGSYSVRGLLVDPRDDNKLVAATGVQWDATDGIYTSDDAGKTWVARTTKLFFDGNANDRADGLILARNPRVPDQVLAASIGSGVWRSDDNGATWNKIGLDGIRPSDLRFDASNPDRLWLCAHADKKLTGGFYRSADGGKSWEKLSSDGPREIVQDSKEPNRLYGLFTGSHVQRSNDAGATWEPFSEGLAINPAKETATSVFEHRALAAGPDFILVGSGDGSIFRLAPGQTTWQKLEKPAIDDGGVPRGKHAWGWAMGSLIVDPRDPNHWFETDFFGLSQTFDAGRTNATICSNSDCPLKRACSCAKIIAGLRGRWNIVRNKQCSTPRRPFC